MRILHYVDVDLVLMCFSVNDPVSYENVTSKWDPEINYHIPNAKKILVGLKTDLRNDQEVIETLAKIRESPYTFKSGIELAKNISALKYVECSSLTGEGVYDVIKESISIFASQNKGEMEIKGPKQNKKKVCLLN